MPALLAAAVTLITAALAFYSLGVWAERVRRELRWWHVACFALGLACDTSGTLLMVRIASTGTAAGNPLLSLMAIIGTLAIALMAIHLVWAVGVLVWGGSRARRSFHRFSLLVWLIWLVPYVAGTIGANLR